MRTCIIMQGLPGSGKSFRARALGGLVLSTDDFWGPTYAFDATRLREAHEWNQERFRDAVRRGALRVVVDNTNMALWEAEPYAAFARAYGYTVLVERPKTPWADDPVECALRCSHGVPADRIAAMLARREDLSALETDL